MHLSSNKCLSCPKYMENSVDTAMRYKLGTTFFKENRYICKTSDKTKTRLIRACKQDYSISIPRSVCVPHFPMQKYGLSASCARNIIRNNLLYALCRMSFMIVKPFFTLLLFYRIMFCLKCQNAHLPKIYPP